MRFTLQEMISHSIAEATEREKVAQDMSGSYEASKEEKSSSKASASDEDKGEKKGSEEGEKTSSVSSGLVEKVASALDFINSNMESVDWGQVKTAVGKTMAPQQGNAPAPKGGPGVGPGSVIQTDMESPTPGTQSTETGQASSGQPEAAGSKDDVGKKDGQTNPETALLTDMNHVPGGTGEQPQLQQEGTLEVKNKVAAARKLWALTKQAADAENPAKLDAGAEPLENPDASGSEDDVPKQPAPFEAQRKLVGSNEGAVNYTKGQAKADPKARMGEVLSEPAQRKSTDPVLHQNLDAASSAGVKLSSVKAAAARAYLRKVAEAGEGDDASSEEKEKAEKLKSILQAKKEDKGNGGGEKKKESQMPAPGMGSVSAVGGAPSTPGM